MHIVVTGGDDNKERLVRTTNAVIILSAQGHAASILGEKKQTNYNDLPIK